MDRDGRSEQADAGLEGELPAAQQPGVDAGRQYVAARKHFTSRRSPGAGEMWLYHRSGGDGLQMTEKPNDQKDLGEPAFSPDGRYLYYSQDTTPGKIFQYNKDSNDQIYVIQRLDRENGQIDEYVTGPGGAVRPTPSPDGKQLAFMRRVRGKTVLFVKALDSGRERPVCDGLDRDLQETWAIHGVYPGMAWTPDSKSIVFWAGGKIQRVDVASGKPSVIPFHVRDERQVGEAVRFPIEVAPSRLPAKMLRGVNVSPQGDRVVYQALGHLWSSSPARRHAEAPDRAERSLRDPPRVLARRPVDRLRHLGRRRDRLAARGRRGGRRGPGGHPTSGSLRRAGVFAGRQADRLSADRGRLHSHAPLVRRAGDLLDSGQRERGVPGEQRRRAAALRRRFGPRLLPGATARGQARAGLVVARRRGRRVHATSDAATEFRVSPDGRWLAFRERFKAFVAPFVATGKPIEIGPKASAMPVSAGRRRTPASSCTGRATRSASTGRSVRSSSPAI